MMRYNYIFLDMNGKQLEHGITEILLIGSDTEDSTHLNIRLYR